MYSDIQEKIKESRIEVESIKKMLASSNLKDDMVLIEGNEIDDDDRAFISQMFMDISVDTGLSPKHRKHTIEKSDEVNNFSVKGLSMGELNEMIKDLGKVWDFDIMKVYEYTNHNIVIVGKYLAIKYGIKDHF